jgi:negative regulator of replication initiation
MITKGEYSFPQSHWKDISEDAKDMVRKMLTVNPKKRSTCR